MAGQPIGNLNTIVLLVQDMNRSVVFYRDVLGLAVLGAGGPWAFFDAGAVTLALQVHPEGTKPQGYAVELVLRVPDATQAHETLMERGVVFLNEIRQFTQTDHGASFRDPDGHLFTIMGPLTEAGT